MKLYYRLLAVFFILVGVLFSPIDANVYAQTQSSDIDVSLTFAPGTITLLSFSKLTITITNNNVADLTSLAFSNSLPAELSINDPNNLTSDCGGTVTADVGTSNIILSGGTVTGGGGSCSVSVSVISSSSGIITNTMPIDGVTGYYDALFVSNDTAASADLNVAEFDFPAAINKEFDPDSIAPGDISRFSVSIFNPNGFKLVDNGSDPMWEDNLPAGVYIADTPNVTTSEGCGLSPVVDASGGGTVLRLVEGEVPAKVGEINGECTVEVDVTSIVPGNHVNTIPAANLKTQNEAGTISVSNIDPASATLNVDTILPPTVTKLFAPNTIWVGQTSRLTIRINNTDQNVDHELTELSLSDILSDTPTNDVVLADPVNPVLTGCGSVYTLTAEVGQNNLTLSNATIAANSTCLVQVNVTSNVQGEYTNNIPADSISCRQGVTNASPATADLNVQAAKIAKEFSDSSILAGDESTLTITLYNPTGEIYTGVSITDSLPNTLTDSNLYFTGIPSTTCGAGEVTFSTSSWANDTLTLTNGTIPSGSVSTPGECTITATVTTADTALTVNHTNSIPADSLNITSHPTVTNLFEVHDTIRVEAQSIDVVKSFSPGSIEQNVGISKLRITLRNPTDAILHITELIDEFDYRLVPDLGTVTTTCINGQVTAHVGTNNVDDYSSLTLTGLDANGAEIPAGSLAVPGTCYFEVEVSSSATGSISNSIPINSITTVEGLTNLEGESTSISMYPQNQGITGNKRFYPDRILAGGNSLLRITLYAPADQAITGLSVTDSLPSGVTISNENESGTTVAASSTCGGVIIANTGESTISLVGGSISQGSSCRIDVWVTSDVANAYLNTITTGQITNDQGQTTQSNLTRTLYVSEMEISKIFTPSTIAPNGRSTLTITFSNKNDAVLINLSASDNLNTMGGTNFKIANPANAITTCSGGTVTAVPGQQVISISGGTIPAKIGSVPGICTVSVDVIASESISPLPSTLTNTMRLQDVTAAIQGVGTVISPIKDATASITVTPLTIGVVKGFDPLTVFGGSSSVMSIQLINPNNAMLTGIAFSDTMPEGMYIANPPGFSTGTCGGTISGNPDDGSFSYSGGTLQANKRCTLTLNVTMNVNGNRTNEIVAGGVTTFNGAENSQGTQATLTNLPGASITKYFTPAEILLGETAQLTVEIKNTGNIPLTVVGVTDNLPSGMTLASSSYTNTCNGTVTAVQGANSFSLANGSIPAGPDTTCQITVTVTADSEGLYTNIIGQNSITTNEGATNIEPAIDELKITGSPSMKLEKTLDVLGSSPVPYDQSDTLAFDFIVTNTGDIDLHNVTISDPDIPVFDSCTPALGSTLAPAATMVCEGSYTVTEPDEIAGSYTNTATADSDETDPITDSVTIPIGTTNLLTIKKVLHTTGPYELGDLLEYTVTVENIGSTTLTNVTVNDPDVDTFNCTPEPPTTLTGGQSITCNGSYTITQTDVDTGSFTNIATADSVETDPVSDSVTVDIETNASLEIYKQVISNGPYDTIGARVDYDISAVNTGDQTLTNVVISDPTPGVVIESCDPGQNATLATGEILSCSAYYLITADDIANGGFNNTAYADSDQTGQVSDTAEVITQTPSIDLQKTGSLNDANLNGHADAGETISYTFRIENTGQVTLTDVEVKDLVGGVTVNGSKISELTAGAVDNTTYTGTYTLTQADINAGSFTNTASVTGIPPIGSPVSDLDSHVETLTAAPELTLVKTGTLNHGGDGQADVGDTITYEIVVTNTGNVTLTGVVITDPDVTLSNATVGTLEPGESNSASPCTGTYTLTQTDIDSGSFENTATVTGTPPEGDDVTDTDNHIETLTAYPSISLVKSGTLNIGGNSRADAGDTITYTFTVQNTGNVTLTNISITDPDVTVSGGPITLAPGQTDSSTFTGTYSLTQTDVDTGSFTNTASVSGNPPTGSPVTDSDDDIQTLTAVPSVRLIKTGTLNVGSNGRVDAGDTITYVFTVQNDGNVTLTNLRLSDPHVTINGGPIAQLDPGQSDNSTFTGTYTLTLTDIDAGSFENTATVLGSPPTGDDVSDIDSDVQTLTADASITLQKTGVIYRDVVAPDYNADPGDEIRYSFIVTNTGNVTLTDITITDPDATITGGPITLEPGASDTTTFTGVHVLTQPEIDSGTFTNTAEVSGDPPSGSPVTNTDDDTQNLGDDPKIGIAKQIVGDPDEVSPGTWDITFELRVKNYGNVTLTAIQVTDDLTATFPSTDAVFTLRSITSSDFTVNANYDGDTDINLLDGTDTLAFEEEGTITFVVRVIPSSGGPFLNSAIVTAQPPTGDPVTDTSTEGVDPDPDDDRDPTNNNDNTPVEFGANLFDPPSGEKTVNDEGVPLLEWTMVWINDTNIVNIGARVSDPIPVDTTYEADGIASGTGVPLTAPFGSTDVGVSCTAGTSVVTTTTWCYYEGPTPSFPRGRIIWEGDLGPDLGVSEPENAVNAIHIVFNLRLDPDTYEVENEATISADLDGDGTISGASEVTVVSANEVWSNWPELPDTGFAPGVETDMSNREMVTYTDMGDIVLEIPSLGISAPILGVPIEHGIWNLDWLGDNIGHLENTTFPTWAGNSALTAHSYDRFGNPGLFAELGTLHWGDEIIIHAWGEKYVYEVRTVQNWIKPENRSIITSEELPWLTLITCRGYNESEDSYDWRTVVRAVQVRIEGD